ncbi:peptidase M13 [Corynebacterium phocae]|uniref:Peptidase M13 n=1 Tax=Corynebacterium phocae TaxID=161895 RepID=A0A1L7D0Q6_9CORY|nr:M13-type metalloendopeptidase [Corynebacterium phocae]APT91670.1 peptidase M13 [Corynebacterium phocae]KAA8728646.1 peptidase M13 [Corynebacterium phocae]
MKDLYQFVNGPWLETHVIPEDRGADGTFYALRDEAEEMVHELVKEDDGRPGKLYRSFMDVEKINAAGTAPLEEDFAKLAVEDATQFARVLGELDRTGVGAPVGLYVAKASDSEDAVAYLVQSGLGLPDEAYYRDEGHAQILEEYQAHVKRMLGYLDPARLFGLPVGAAAQRIVELEKELAAGHWDVVASRDAVKTNNPTEFGDLPAKVQEMLRGMRVPEARVIVSQPSFLDHLDGLLTDDRLADWQLWATWHILQAHAAHLTEEISKANFEFYGTALTGATEQRDRWKRALGFAGFVGQEIGQRYVDQHFPASHKEEMLELVDYLTDAYRSRISTLEWMTEDTRKRALEKLEKFTAKIGYPDTWKDYGDLSFTDDVVDNARAGHAWSHDYEVAKLGKPADRSEWFATPQTVNAFYNPTVNDITFPAAILRPPFYDAQADAAENFGAIGAVIGHEIGHGFDDQGSQYDGTGNLNSWWTDADRAAFEELTKKLVGQFQGKIPSVLAGTDSPGVNGAFTLGENIGDLGGLGIAVVAYKKYCADKGLDPLGQLAPFNAEGAQPELAEQEWNGLQRFFLAWARVWRTAIRPELAAQYLAVDPHSPGELRCNLIAGNVAELYEAFDVPEDSPMYIAPEDRVTIW